jgi:hypothetical protein
MENQENHAPQVKNVEHAHQAEETNTQNATQNEGK